MHNGRVEETFSRKERQDLRNKRTGLAIFQASWILVFVVLILVHFQLRSQAVTWPPPGVEKLGAVLPTIVTIGLIASSVVASRAPGAVKAGRVGSFVAQWRIALGLAVLFVLVMAYQWAAVPIGEDGQYGILFRVLVGFHGVHALVVGAYMVMVYRSGQAGQYGPANFWPVEAAVGLWNFVTVAWILFYLVLYWI